MYLSHLQRPKCLLFSVATISSKECSLGEEEQETQTRSLASNLTPAFVELFEASLTKFAQADLEQTLQPKHVLNLQPSCLCLLTSWGPRPVPVNL